MLHPSFDPSNLTASVVDAPQLYSNSVKSVVAFLSSPSPDQSQFLQGLYFILAEDLNMLPDLRAKILKKIGQAGGVVMGDSSEYSKEGVDVVICRSRSGPLYIKVRKNNIVRRCLSVCQSEQDWRHLSGEN